MSECLLLGAAAASTFCCGPACLPTDHRPRWEVFVEILGPCTVCLRKWLLLCQRCFVRGLRAAYAGLRLLLPGVVAEAVALPVFAAACVLVLR